MPTIELLAPAKVNLSLLVGPRRPDGYHELVTVLNTISINDRLRLSLRPATDWRIRVSGRRPVDGYPTEAPALPSDTDNLAGQAATLFVEATNGRVPVSEVDVEIEKHIPVAAGLGGGSSNAAAVLAALNEHFGRPLTTGSLASLAARLGSDVPFFLVGGRAVGRGRGELVAPLGEGPGLPLVIGLPSFPLATPEVYRQFDRRGGPRTSLRQWLADTEDALALLQDALASGDLARVAGALRNDLAESAASLRPEVGPAVQALLAAGSRGATVSGSGPTVFGLASSWEEALGMAPRLTARGYRFVAASATTASVATPVTAPAVPGGAGASGHATKPHDAP